MQTWLVTGGAGFIGANFVLAARRLGLARIVNLDLLTYAGHPENLDGLKVDRDHVFVHGDIGDEALVARLFAEHKPVAVVNFAAESHVDRSILGPQAFIQTNIVGTHTLLAAARSYWQGLEAGAKGVFRFLHVSTDEVYGSLGPKDPAFTEQHQYQPNSPYAASKAAADHLVRAYHHTYGLPVLTTNCSNLVISLPSVLLAWLKLRKRNIGPILDANGWAVNARARINIPFGSSLTAAARLPENAERSLVDPFAEKKRPWKLYLVAAAILVAGLVLWRQGYLARWFGM